MELLSSENILLAGSVLLISGVLIGRLSYRSGLPMLLIFLFVGMFFGTDGLGIQFSDMHTAQFTGMIALCIILFSGGVGTRLSVIKPIVVPGLVLSTVGVLLTAIFTGLFIWWLSGMSWTNIHFPFMVSLLLAATMSSTDSASVFGILGQRKIGLRNHLRPMLELESGSNDPMAYMLTLMLIETIVMGKEMSGLTIATELLLQFVVGGAVGLMSGRLTLRLIALYERMGRKVVTKEDSSQAVSMISIMMLGSVFLTFSVTDMLSGNGYLAVYICGIVIGNAKLSNRRAITKFLDGMTWLAQIVVFLMLGLLVNPHEMLSVAAVSMLIGLFMILVGRPLSVFLSLTPFGKIDLKSKAYISWVGLRGAVPIIFATYPVVSDIEGAGQIFNIVFFVTILSLVIQGTTVISGAKKLGLVDEDESDEDDFGVELADELPTSLQTITLTADDLASGTTLRDMKLPAGSLVMMIKRDGDYIVPNGTRNLREGDVLLIISESK